MKKEIKKKVVTTGTPIPTVSKIENTVVIPNITEAGYFGNEEMHSLINKVNEIIKFINK